jgi:CelD/BcsL family acetyltransferase involved in cellulose biosynthesis
LRPRCIVAEDGGAPVGFLPYFVSERGPLRRAWSLPFGTYGGPVGVDDVVARTLLDEYRRTLSRAGWIEVGWIDFHNRIAAAERWYETHVVDLTGGFETVWNERFAVQRRQRTRRAERLGVTVARSRGDEALRGYFDIFRSRIEGFGRDMLYTEALYRELFARGGDRVRLYLARLDDAVIGGHLNFYYRDSVIAWYGVVAREHEGTQAGTLLYTECIRDACNEGFRTYNLGASLGKASLVHFKESLGGVAHRYPVHVTRTVLGRLAARARRWDP